VRSVGLIMQAELDRLRAEINALARVDETQRVRVLLEQCTWPESELDAVKQKALGHIARLRKVQKNSAGINRLMAQYRLSTLEGVALMCLAEALLRIPDSHTRDELIRDKLSHANWAVHLGQDASLFVNASTWGLFIAGQWVQMPSDDSLYSSLQRLIARSSEGLVRKAVELAVKFMGQQFVAAQTIEEALRNSRASVAKGHTYSFDMLGEAAVCEADAQAYFSSYAHAIEVIGQDNTQGVFQGNGISVKLSALHPRYTLWQENRVCAELYPRLFSLALSAKNHNIAFNVDAEESERLDLSLDLFTRLAFEPELRNWNGLGLAVQAYQTRATAVIEFVAALARSSGRVIQLRLVKGAYWDTEIKRCQTQGLAHFPVFTQKVHTDLSYLCCAELMLRNSAYVYSQFATHNAHTYAAVQHMAARHNVHNFEMQCLHGMGEGLYQKCRIYAPVGSHQTLLPYLVRRLLENGANTSFVNQIVDPKVNVNELVEHPVVKLRTQGVHPNLACVPAPQLFGENRLNSTGLDLHCKGIVEQLQCAVQKSALAALEPVSYSTQTQVQQALNSALQSFDIASDWFSNGAGQRALCLLRAAELLESDSLYLINLLVHEAGKTIPAAHLEVREAIDFCRYYAVQISTLNSQQSESTPRLAVCISPWNFPLAIFVGQVTGALASAHAVVAKPAEQTPQIARHAVRLLHAAGVPATVLQLVFGDGEAGSWLSRFPAVDTVLFTGSNAAAKHIQTSLLKHDSLRLPALLIAETGGQNAMVVDSSALLEQVVGDVLESAFGSAGQRCSALRVLCVQDDIADNLIALLKAAMQELQVGAPASLSTDLGPLIDQDAWQAVHTHIQRMKEIGVPVFQGERIDPAAQGFFIAPTLVELQHLHELQREVFGPVLHVLRYKAGGLPALLHALNATGYALTFGIHSRIRSTIDLACNTINAGNVYVNRNMVGAVVGSQPFGGHGQSGTGPKAGGPHYLPTLMRLAQLPPVHNGTLPGPTGEQNLYHCWPRGRVWCTARDEQQLRQQIEAVLTTGNVAVVQRGMVKEWQSPGIEWVNEIHLEHMDVAVCECTPQLALAVARELAAYSQRIIPVILANPDGSYPAYRLLREQLVCTNTAAAGGNVELITRV
jgi:RHH-type transcriptional regulator, proline utilization regulon repressor / proline dehydrogenase / delta 1-pyrroline-5-carboxylate dehydrogenase